MRSFIRAIQLVLLCLSVSFCSSTPELEATPEASEENYQSSGVYNDIENESRSTSSEPYSDDDYGQMDDEGAADEELFASEGVTVEEVQDEPAPATQTAPKAKKAVTKAAHKPKKSQAMSNSHSPAFKNGMYGVKKDCRMHGKPNLQSKKQGSVNRGKKLWMENHDKNWVKVFKKSGPVYINKSCL